MSHVGALVSDPALWRWSLASSRTGGRRSHDHPRSARRQRLAQRPERDFPDGRFRFHPPEKQNRAPQLHDCGVRDFDFFSGVLPHLSRLPRVVLHHGPTHFLRSGVVPPDLSDDSAHAHRPGRRHRADDFGDAVPRAEAALRASQKNRPLDVAVVDVCFRDRRGGLLAALSDFPAKLRTSFQQSLSCRVESAKTSACSHAANVSFTPASFRKMSGAICWNRCARGA